MHSSGLAIGGATPEDRRNAAPLLLTHQRLAQILPVQSRAFRQHRSRHRVERAVDIERAKHGTIVRLSARFLAHQAGPPDDQWRTNSPFIHPCLRTAQRVGSSRPGFVTVVRHHQDDGVVAESEAVEFVKDFKIGPLFTPPALARPNGPLATLILAAIATVEQSSVL